MEWINDHQTKSTFLLKSLQIINYYTKTNFGLQILKQYEALDFFEGFKEHLLKSTSDMKVNIGESRNMKLLQRILLKI